MAKNSIRDYSATNSLNTDIQSIDISEGCSPAGINNAIREVMADLKDVSTGAVALESPAMDSLTVDTTGIVYSGGNVGIGTSSPEAPLHISTGGGIVPFASSQIVSESTGNNYIELNGGSTSTTALYFGDSSDQDAGGVLYNHSDDSLSFRANAASRMRIASDGRVHVNQTSDWASSMLSAYATGAPALSARTNQTNGTCLITRHDGGGTAYNVQFYNGASFVGSIQTTASATSYVTSSDYRLKTDVTYDWDATSRLKQLKPARFAWIADGDDAIPVDGFLAHEVQDIVPEAISGTKDAMRDEEYEVTPAVLDDDGNVVTPAVMGTRSVPDYQGIDQSKLVPLLVKTIQELEARITALEAN